MATVAPFAGWRYNREKSPQLSDVIVPPYDVISDSELARLKKNPFNFSHIILPDGEHKHQAAANLFNRWRQEKVFVQDQGPQLYFYKQTFKLKPQELFCQDPRAAGALSRTGILSRVHVEDYSAKIILPHEKTFSGPKADRYLLMEAAQGNMEPVFLGYDSPRFSGDDFENSVSGRSPAMEFKDSDGVKHELWAVSDTQVHREVQDFLKALKFYILDGHHRYETALKFYKDHQKDGRPSLAFALANICSFKQPGTIILPTHRAVKGLKNFDPAAVEQSLKVLCSIQKNLELSQAEEILKNTDQPAFALKFSQGGYWGITYTGGRAGRLDLEVLHGEVFAALSSGGSLKEDQVAYIKDIKELESRVGSGEFQLGILVKPSSCEEVMTVAENSRVMPHKSTFFYPKIPSGLVVNLFE